MRKVLVAVLACLVLCLSSPPASAAPCLIEVRGDVGVVVCGGIIIDRLPLPHVTVTQSVTHEVIRRVPVPGPIVRVTVRPDPVTITGPTRPGPTKTVIITKEVPGTPGKTTVVTKIPKPTSLPSPQAKTSTRQTPTPSATIGPATPLAKPGKTFDLGDGHTTVVEASLGILALILLIVGFLATLYGGYILGYREARGEDTKYLRGLLESVKRRKIR